MTLWSKQYWFLSYLVLVELMLAIPCLKPVSGLTSDPVYLLILFPMLFSLDTSSKRLYRIYLHHQDCNSNYTKYAWNSNCMIIISHIYHMHSNLPHRMHHLIQHIKIPHLGSVSAGKKCASGASGCIGAPNAWSTSLTKSLDPTDVLKTPLIQAEQSVTPCPKPTPSVYASPNVCLFGHLTTMLDPIS